MNEYDKEKGATPEGVRATLRGWTLFIVVTLGIFGAAYAWIEI